MFLLLAFVNRVFFFCRGKGGRRAYRVCGLYGNISSEIFFLDTHRGIKKAEKTIGGSK